MHACSSMQQRYDACGNVMVHVVALCCMHQRHSVCCKAMSPYWKWRSFSNGFIFTLHISFHPTNLKLCVHSGRWNDVQFIVLVLSQRQCYPDFLRLQQLLSERMLLHLNSSAEAFPTALFGRTTPLLTSERMTDASDSARISVSSGWSAEIISVTWTPFSFKRCTIGSVVESSSPESTMATRSESSVRISFTKT